MFYLIVYGPSNQEKLENEICFWMNLNRSTCHWTEKMLKQRLSAQSSWSPLTCRTRALCHVCTTKTCNQKLTACFRITHCNSPSWISRNRLNWGFTLNFLFKEFKRPCSISFNFYALVQIFWTLHDMAHFKRLVNICWIILSSLWVLQTSYLWIRRNAFF